MPSLMKIGVPAGCSSDASCGENLETFTVFGFAYGLLQADLVEDFLLQSRANTLRRVFLEDGRCCS